jgi:hypothetical protein
MARKEGYELLVIDTGSGSNDDLYRAHLLADVVLTPLNDSPVDLHGLFAEPNTPQAAKLNYGTSAVAAFPNCRPASAALPSSALRNSAARSPSMVWGAFATAWRIAR